MAKFFKILLIIFSIVITLFLVAIISFAVITKDAVLDENKLINPNQNITICDDEGNEITSASLTGKRKSVCLENLSEDTINAFIASEDRTFYSHKGLNYKRMIKALYTNIVSRSFKEGASTISQQLIKNTHLTGDKTIKRKLNEIKLTKKLEKKYSKNEILEMYMNTIYFGHNCYGLQCAAEFYFDKKAENLTLPESATLVGLLISPNNYSPFKYPEKSLKRRNLVLKSMLDCKYIDESTYNDAVNTPLNAKERRVNDKNADYLNSVYSELEDVDLNFYSLNDGCKILTYCNQELQQLIESFDYTCDNSVIISSNDGQVIAYKSSINGAQRQPGSTIKPLLVYAPSIEEKLIHPFTKILDEKIDYNGYSPENYDKKYHGYVTVAESIKNSYNIPAVKTLNALSLTTAEQYFNKMNIKLEDGEKNLSLALGGMQHGLSLKDITDRYMIFANGGTYFPSKFIKEIIDKNGKTIYKNETYKNNVFSQGTCSLINDMLIATSKTGTAKKLSGFDYDVATKTGTCGNNQGNTDAYAISYTSKHSIGVWLGDKDNNRLEVTGGNDCCECMKQILAKLYDKKTPDKLDVNSGTATVELDAEEYNTNNRILLADTLSPKYNVIQVKVLIGNEPKETSEKFSKPTIIKPTIKVENKSVIIELCQTKYYSYIVKRSSKSNFEVIYDGKWKKEVIDNPAAGSYTYTVTPYYLNGDKKILGQEIILPTVNLNGTNTSPQVKIPKIVDKDWFNL